MSFNVANCPDCGENVCRVIQVDDTAWSFWMCPACGTIHGFNSWYRHITTEEFVNNSKNGWNRGRYVCDVGIEVIGIDNRSGKMLIEEFPDLCECLT